MMGHSLKATCQQKAEPEYPYHQRGIARDYIPITKALL